MRARSAEGKLQVKMAQLTYQKSRLVGFWSHLERQRGGGLFLGGPGEKQKELDRRMLVDQIAILKKKLEHVSRNRTLQRSARQKVPFPLVGLVGYTNAGKSTLFNGLTHAGVVAEDALFATLDPTMRQVKLPSGRRVILSDTVGFISDLPTLLVAAFRSTLQEILEADVVLHIQDIAHPEWRQQRKDVLKILKEIGFTRENSIIDVYNKIDLLPFAKENLSCQVLDETQHGNGVQDDPFLKDPKDILKNNHPFLDARWFEPKDCSLALSTQDGHFVQDLPVSGTKGLDGHGWARESLESQQGLTEDLDQTPSVPLGVSALKEQGLVKILERLDGFFDLYDYRLKVILPLTAGKAWAWCCAYGHILFQKNTQEDMVLELMLSPFLYEGFKSQFPHYPLEVLAQPKRQRL
jgi:50S ribosomal subunit-associated GTPase HflX